MNCIYPHVINNPNTHKDMLVPCRKCTACRISKLSFMNKLCNEEVNTLLRSGRSSSFLTLTYNSVDDIPSTGLSKDVYKKFLKRLRFNLTNTPYARFKYIGCGEYGDTKFRPHYHFILFGVPRCTLTDKIIRSSWNYGFIYFGDLIPGGIRYVLDYICSQPVSSSDRLAESFTQEGLQYPFHSSSRGIGSDWLNRISSTATDKEHYRIKDKSLFLPSYYARRYGLISDSSNMEVYNYELAFLKNKSLQTQYNLHGKVHEKVSRSSSGSFYNLIDQRAKRVKTALELLRGRK